MHIKLYIARYNIHFPMHILMHEYIIILEFLIILSFIYVFKMLNKKQKIKANTINKGIFFKLRNCGHIFFQAKDRNVFWGANLAKYH